MSYENAPATILLATTCAACGRDLGDALSVELGIGPECRRKCGWTKRQGFGPGADADWKRAAKVLAPSGHDALLVADDARTSCNRLVHRLAIGDLDMDTTIRLIGAVASLGYRKLAQACTPALRKVTVETEGETLVVKADYNESFNAAVRSVPGARWDRERKVRVVPATSRAALWTAIVQGFGPLALVFGERVAIT
jgi:Family of unknown function (DUF6011)